MSDLKKFSPLQKARLEYQPTLPDCLKQLFRLQVEHGNIPKISNELAKLFPRLSKQPRLKFKLSQQPVEHSQVNVGVVLSGGQAPGGHNVISGLYDALKKLNPNSKLIGFLNGPKGILKNEFIEINDKNLSFYRNQGGFDLIGSGRDKIEQLESFEAAEKTVKANSLNGLLIIGGDDSNTNAALLAEYFLSRNVACAVVGAPKTIDGDLQNEDVEISFGFDTACKIYSEIIGNIATDALSAKKYYYFIKLMGRSASHVTFECALKINPNLALIGEEIEEKKKTLKNVTDQICDVICQRAEHGKDYGIILIPEGIVEFIPEFKELIVELNHLLTPGSLQETNLNSQPSKEAKIRYITQHLHDDAKECFKSLPEDIQLQLLIERDPHGNVQVSKIESERLFMQTAQIELEKRKTNGQYKGKFSAQPHFCGYEGRSGLPSNFDSQYCYALGHVAALLVSFGVTGYMSCAQQLKLPVEQWSVAGAPIVPMMNVEIRHGKPKPVIKKALVDTHSFLFNGFRALSTRWIANDFYFSPGPIQFFGPSKLTDSVPLIISKQEP